MADLKERQALERQPFATRLSVAAASIRADFALAILDTLLVTCAYLAVLALRFDGGIPPEWWHAFRAFVPVAVVVHVFANWSWRLYGQVWRYAGIAEARRIVLAGQSAGLVLAVLYLSGGRRMPASVVVLGALVATTLIGAVRFQSRLFAFQRAPEGRGTPVAIIGAGHAGAAIAREMRRNPAQGLRPVVIVDDDVRKIGRVLDNVPIVGGIERLEDAVRQHGAEQVLFAIPSASGELVRRVVADADRAGVRVRVLPSVTELLGQAPHVQDVRDLEIADLLGRQQVATDLNAVRRLLSGKRVLITGAGGSIGSELSRQVAACEPAALVLLDHDETHLYDAVGRLSGPATQVLADIRDVTDLDRAFAAHRPEVVFHAAAHKHVPLLETHACEAARTNVFGTANVVAAATQHGVDHLVFISTDKAVRPTSVMGASKRLAELLVVSRAADRAWCAVRFGNVLGSRGSVVPTFVRQIQHGGPVTVTDPRMTRFFMSIGEAVQLVLQAAALARGGEIFMLDMGEPVRIVDLAERMIRLSGRNVGEDIAIEFTGLRPGEKLVEELRSPEEEPSPTTHAAIVALRPAAVDVAHLEGHLSELTMAVERRDDAQTAALLLEMALPIPDRALGAAHAGGTIHVFERRAGAGSAVEGPS